MSAAPLRVLVVDDEPPIRKLLRMGLTAQGYQTLEAPNGKAALDLLNRAPDLIILDLGLPDIARARSAAHDPRAQRGRSHRRALQPRRRSGQGAGARSRR